MVNIVFKVLIIQTNIGLERPRRHFKLVKLIGRTSAGFQVKYKLYVVKTFLERQNVLSSFLNAVAIIFTSRAALSRNLCGLRVNSQKNQWAKTFDFETYVDPLNAIRLFFGVKQIHWFNAIQYFVKCE